MKKIYLCLCVVTLLVFASGLAVHAFSEGTGNKRVSRQDGTQLVQLNIFDDPSVDRRIAEAQRKIDVGKRRGQLTPDEYNRLQAILDRIKERIAKYRADGFVTPSERTRLNEMLTSLEEKIREERTDDDVARRDAIEKRIGDMQRRIDAGVREGQLTREEYNRLQMFLNRIKDRDTRFRADGVLTDDERFSLNQMLNALDERIRFERNDTDTVHREAFDRRLGEMKRKIEVGMRAGQLTLDEACRLSGMLMRIRERESRFRSDGVLTREERVRLNEMLVYLEEQIYEERWDADVNHPLFR